MNEEIKNKILEVLEENHSVSLWSADNRLMVAKQITLNLDEKTKKNDKDSKKKAPDVKSQSISNPVEDSNPMDAMKGKKIEILNTRINSIQEVVKPDVNDLPDIEEENNKRMDVIGQNGNDGLHYNEKKPAKPKKSGNKVKESDKEKFFKKPTEKRQSGLFSKKTKRK